MQAIHRKARELSEERGLAASYLSIGMARWDELFLLPAAPVLLRGLTITPTRARHDDFDLRLDEAAEVNPVLLHKLGTVYGVDTAGLAEQTDPRRLFGQLRELAKAADIPGFDIMDRRVIGTFTYAKLPMVRDLENAEAWEQLHLDGGLPRVPDGLAEALNLLGKCEQQLAALRELVPVGGDVGPVLDALIADQDTPWKLPRLYELRARFGEFGLRPLLEWLTSQGASPELAVQAFDHAWHSSVLAQIRVRDNRYAAYSGAALDEIAEDFRRHDVEHLAANRARVRRAVAERLRDAQDQHPLQARVIRKQAALRRRHMPLRRLLDQASDVLCAIKPCWAMSPLVVSQVLPASRLFDVVIFDEASQVTPADAIPFIMRAHQVIVAGDDRQLPPTSFFRQVGESDPDSDEEAEGEDDSLVSFGSGFESILDTLRPLLPTAPLTWHYRSRDGRLVAFSNSRIYDGALTTFPGVIRDDCLRHVVVSQGLGAGQETSVASEAAAVVDLVLAHARTRPGESLGVIALGIRHAERIDELLREVLAEHPGLEQFFAEDQAEPFFVRNLERVQGDERDAIILSIGYGKHREAGCATTGARCCATAVSVG